MAVGTYDTTVVPKIYSCVITPKVYDLSRLYPKIYSVIVTNASDPLPESTGIEE